MRVSWLVEVFAQPFTKEGDADVGLVDSEVVYVTAEVCLGSKWGEEVCCKVKIK